MIQPGTVPVMVSTTLTVANTEYSVVLPRGVKMFDVLANTSNSFRLSYQSGKVAGSTPPFYPVGADVAFTVRNINTKDDLTLYLASATAALNVTVVYWI